MFRISFYNTKEGVGKSTLTFLVSQHFNTELGLTSCIIDASQSEHSLSAKVKSTKDRFPNMVSTPDIIQLNSANELAEKDFSKYEYQFIDIDETTPAESIIDYLSQSDYIFVISDAEDRDDFNLDKNYLYKTLKSFISTEDFRTQEVYLLFNKTDDNTLEKLNITESLKQKINILPYVIKKEEQLENFEFNSNYLTDISSLSSAIFDIVNKNDLVELLNEE